MSYLTVSWNHGFIFQTSSIMLDFPCLLRAELTPDRECCWRERYKCYSFYLVMLVRNGLPKEMGVQSDTKSVRVQDASQLVLIRESREFTSCFTVYFIYKQWTRKIRLNKPWWNSILSNINLSNEIKQNATLLTHKCMKYEIHKQHIVK